MRLLSICVLLAALASADTITLRDGRHVTGSYLGGDARNVRMAVGERVENYAVADITNIAFDNAPAPAPTPRSEAARATFLGIRLDTHVGVAGRVSPGGAIGIERSVHAPNAPGISPGSE